MKHSVIQILIVASIAVGLGSIAAASTSRMVQVEGILKSVSTEHLLIETETGAVKVPRFSVKSIKGIATGLGRVTAYVDFFELVSLNKKKPTKQ